MVSLGEIMPGPKGLAFSCRVQGPKGPCSLRMDMQRPSEVVDLGDCGEFDDGVSWGDHSRA